MEREPEKIESRFLGHKFVPGDKVKLTDLECDEHDNDPRFEGIDLSETFTVKTAEIKHRIDTKEYDDVGEYDFQIVELVEIPLKVANDRIAPVE